MVSTVVLENLMMAAFPGRVESQWKKEKTSLGKHRRHFLPPNTITRRLYFIVSWLWIIYHIIPRVSRFPRDYDGLEDQIDAASTSMKHDGISPFYTTPIIQDDFTGPVVSDSAAITAYSDKRAPLPSQSCGQMIFYQIFTY
ncbi:hypothetical protein ARMSODRAFT_1056533 [Armillaria solidipes]|uniref:Uncharacterized protein n=1 Tax=Armillaria solidipes TaxID=1076256 RepID=A0A2H3B5A9_9AGAR|nr:hypothetical protein ARMSODRAFT_1056533 [Armillaria solidipes]